MFLKNVLAVVNIKNERFNPDFRFLWKNYNSSLAKYHLTVFHYRKKRPCILGSLLIRIRTSGQMVSVGIYVTRNRNITDSIERFYVSRQWYRMIK